MIKLPKLKSTFSRNVFLPGLIVLLLLSVVCALFPDATEMGLKRVQGAIYTNLHWMYSLMVTFFLIFQLVPQRRELVCRSKVIVLKMCFSACRTEKYAFGANSSSAFL